jgi:hypothetical protein
MGTSLSGLTPATTFDGLLKTSDNEPLDGTLKAISTGDGTDTMLELSTTALQIGGATGMYWDNTNGRLGIGTNAPSVPFEVYGNVRFRNALNVNDNIYNSASGIVNINSLAYFNGITDKVGIGENTPTSSLHIKGSGTTSATTSLLVQNSAGTNVFKVVDDNTMFYHTHKFRSAGGYLYIDGEANANRSLRIGQNFTASSYDGHIFKTFDGTSYSEAMRITGANDQFVGIGETTPTARLQVKGSGNDNTTTSLLVQNSDGDDLLSVDDNGTIDFGLPNATQSLRIANIGSSTIAFSGPSNLTMYATTLRLAASVNTAYVGSQNFNIGADSNLGARLGVKGSGTTSATTSLLVQNSAGTSAFEVKDNLDTHAYGGLYSSIIRVNYINTHNNGYSVMRTHLGDGNASFFQSVAVGQTTTPTARLQVIGSGNDATTTALLVQNSDAEELLKIDDQGVLSVTGHENGKITLEGTGGTSVITGNRNFTLASNFGGYIRLSPSGAAGVGVGVAPTSRLHIQGSGTTSATTALLVQNSAGTGLFGVTDDGSVSIQSFKQLSASSSNYGIILEGTTSMQFKSWAKDFRFFTQNGIVAEIKNDGSTIIGGNTPDASAKLQVDSTTKGFLPPRMTTTERDAISTPAAGLMVYNTTTNKAQCYNGSTWNDLF